MVDWTSEETIPEAEITFERTDQWWVVHHDETGITSQGETKQKAHLMISEAVMLEREEISHPIDSLDVLFQDTEPPMP